jgi:hypothetical protein
MKCRQNRLYGAGCDCHHTAPKIIRAGFLSLIAVIYSKPCSAFLISSAMCHSLSSLIFLVWRCTSLHPPALFTSALFNHFSCVSLHIPSSWCGAAHPFILPWHCSIIFLMRHCTCFHPPVALLNNFSCEALHVLSSFRGITQ